MNYSLNDYVKMVEGQPRVVAFSSAISRLVSSDSVVLDLGAGFGAMSLLACRAGARRVYAIDTNSVVRIIPKVAVANGYGGRIVAIHGDSRALQLPERVDVIVADLRGFLPLYRGTQDIIADSCRRFLKPGGVVMPGRDVMYIAPVTESSLLKDLDSRWTISGIPFDLSACWALERFGVVRSRATASDVLAPPSQWANILWGHNSVFNFEEELRFVFRKDGRLDGFMQWFDIDFGHGLMISNSPDSPSSCYGRCTFMLPRALHVQAGWQARLHLKVHLLRDHEVWEWSGGISDHRGGPVGDFSESSIRNKLGLA